MRNTRPHLWPDTARAICRAMVAAWNAGRTLDALRLADDLGCVGLIRHCAETQHVRRVRAARGAP